MAAGSSTRKKTHCDLAGSSSSQKAKDFLISLANLRDDKDGLRQLRFKFPAVMEAVSRTVVATYSAGQKVYRPGSPQHDEWARKSWLIPLRDTLRALWRAPDVRTKRWGLSRISQDFFLQGDPNTVHRPGGQGSSDFLLSWQPPTPTERFLLALMEWADLLKFCANEDCQARYFIATRRDQKYCCSDCAEAVDRASKRRWWEKTGKHRRLEKRKALRDSCPMPGPNS